MSKHNELNVLTSLSKKRDCRVYGMEIQVLTGKGDSKIYDLGGGSWGKIDYLVNYCHYRIVYVNKYGQ